MDSHKIWTRNRGAGHKPVTPATEAHEARQRKTLPLIVTAPEPSQRSGICKNTESVSVPVTAFARYLTKYPYLTPEWSKAYAGARNQIEGKNGWLKLSTGANLAQPGERRIRGWAKNHLIVLIKLLASNINTIIVWLNNADSTPAPATRTKRGRPKKSGIEEYALQPNGPPLRIVGRKLTA